MSVSEMEASSAWLLGKGTSIAPRMVQAIEWAERSFQLPMYNTILTKAVPKHIPAADAHTKACGLGVMSASELILCSESHSLPIIYFARIWVCIYLTSCRAACWLGCSIFTEWVIRGSLIVFNISITKSHNEMNTTT